MQIPPLSVVASWPSPNYTDPETRGPANAILLSILLGIATVLLVIRLYSRARISHALGLDDALIVLAYVPATAFTIGGILAEFNLGWDKHTWDLQPDLVTPGLKMSLVGDVLFDIATNLTKLSMLALIYKAMAAGKSRARHLALILAILIAMNCLVFVLVTIFQCSPVSAYWTLSLLPQKCINETAHLLAAGIINTVTDFLIVLLPVRTVMALDLPRKQMIVVIALFGGGLFAAAAGAARTFFTWQMTTSPDHDITWRSYLVVLTSSLELFVGIICASLPATKPFFVRYVPRLFGSSVFTQSSQALPITEKFRYTRLGQKSTATLLGLEQSTPGRAAAQEKVPKRPSLPPPPNLNKPLPKVHVRMSLVKDASFAAVSGQAPGVLDRSSRNSSVYQFTPYEDGHISVHKTRSRGK